MYLILILIVVSINYNKHNVIILGNPAAVCIYLIKIFIYIQIHMTIFIIYEIFINLLYFIW